MFEAPLAGPVPTGSVFDAMASEDHTYPGTAPTTYLVREIETGDLYLWHRKDGYAGSHVQLFGPVEKGLWCPNGTPERRIPQHALSPIVSTGMEYAYVAHYAPPTTTDYDGWVCLHRIGIAGIEQDINAIWLLPVGKIWAGSGHS